MFSIRVRCCRIAGSPVWLTCQVIAHAPTRAQALTELRKALRNFQVVGLPTNLDFCERVARHPAFAKGGVTTAFLEKHGKAVMPPPANKAPPPPHALVLAAVAVLLQEVIQCAPFRTNAGLFHRGDRQRGKEKQRCDRINCTRQRVTRHGTTR